MNTNEDTVCPRSLVHYYMLGILRKLVKMCTVVSIILPFMPEEKSNRCNLLGIIRVFRGSGPDQFFPGSSPLELLNPERNVLYGRVTW